MQLAPVSFPINLLPVLEIAIPKAAMLRLDEAGDDDASWSTRGNC
jgi:hypothetical protein